MPGCTAPTKTALPSTGLSASRTLESRLSSWRGWQIRARCGDPLCPPNRLVCVGDMLSAWGDITVRDMTGRMRCSVCGQRAQSIVLLKGGTAGQVIHFVRGTAAL
ncbi:hypothetical protein QMO56_24390 [Roseomonas sp. E05]|uniref:hypothetical protein n=1 Tax=Roseomonas sp. E05 TaxID=3046310 RepID=UPI0024B8FC2D|nr:hypothetical protein [Roseomonas sp. E05]MDJ0391255.1 hypothetical protein [Roseomonas sp. E05]